MKVYKYRQINSDNLESLENDYFWASSIENLNDIQEGVFETSILEQQIQLLSNIEKNSSVDIRESLNKFLDYMKQCGVFSLSKTHTNEVLWSHYADSHQGFCIEYDLNKLMRLNTNSYEICDVDYVLETPKVSIDDFLLKDEHEKNMLLKKIIATKAKRWSYEEEIRIISSLKGRQNYDYRAIESIFFGAKMTEENQEKIMELLQGRNIKYFKSKSVRNAYQLQFHEIQDKNSEVSQYKSNIATIQDESINVECINNKKYITYAHYLQKAAEIIQHEPYCDEISNVDFSTKSTVDAPIIYVQYHYNNSDYQEYFTLEEIDIKMKIKKMRMDTVSSTV